MRLSALVGGYVEKVDVTTPLAEAAQRMVSGQLGSLVVTRNGRVTGIFTEHDVTRAAAHHADMDTATVDEWMTDFPHLARPDWTIEEAADAMVENGIRHLPIMDETGSLVGIVSIKDLVWAMRGPEIEPGTG